MKNKNVLIEFGQFFVDKNMQIKIFQTWLVVVKPSLEHGLLTKLPVLMLIPIVATWHILLSTL